MANVSNPAGSPRVFDTEGIADLCAEFPCWAVEAREDDARTLWRATRTGRAGHLAVEANSVIGLREALDELDRVDCRHALIALRDELRALKADAEAYGLAVRLALGDGTARSIVAQRGMFTWASGVLIGPIDQPAAVARTVLHGNRTARVSMPGTGCAR